MKTFTEFQSLLSEAKMDDGWTTPLVGKDIAAHLSKNQVKGIVSDPDFHEFVKHDRNIPVFKVKKSGAGFKSVRVGNTEGKHFVEYEIAKHGAMHRKVVYAKSDGIHPDVKWSIHSHWDKEEEDAKKAKKK